MLSEERHNSGLLLARVASGDLEDIRSGEVGSCQVLSLVLEPCSCNTKLTGENYIKRYRTCNSCQSFWQEDQHLGLTGVADDRQYELEVFIDVPKINSRQLGSKGLPTQD